MARFGERYANCGWNVDEWYETQGEASSHFDVCDKCVVEHGDELMTKGIGKIKPYQEGEPVGYCLSYDAMERPPYTQKGDDGYVYPERWEEWYRCASCNVILVDEEDTDQQRGQYPVGLGNHYISKVKVKLRKERSEQ